MKYRMIIAIAALSLAACGGDKNNGGTNNGTAGTNNDTAGTNNGTTAGTNNGTTAGTNNGTTAGTNNGTTTGSVDFISADVDGVAVLANSDEGGIEPMGDAVQLRKTTGEGGATPVQIFRLTVPNTDVASYDCANDDVLVEYIELNGQLATIWVAADTCTIDVTESGANPGDLVVGSFTASATDGNTTVELTSGAFQLTR